MSCTDWVSGKTKWGMFFHPEKCSIPSTKTSSAPIQIERKIDLIYALMKGQNTSESFPGIKMNQMAPETYKIAIDIAPDYIIDLVNIKKSNYNFRREKQASISAVKSKRYGERYFRYEAARIWNYPPNDLRLAESFH